MKRCICLLLAVILLVGVFPAAFAAELTGTTESPAEDTLLPTDDLPGDAAEPVAELANPPNTPTEETGGTDLTVETPAEESAPLEEVLAPSEEPIVTTEETTISTEEQEPTADDELLDMDDELLDMDDELLDMDDELLEMDGISLFAMDSSQSGILLFNYTDNGDYTTRLNYQVSCTFQLNGNGAVKTAYIKNMGWHFARYGGTPYPDNPLYCLEPYRDFAASTSGNTVDRGVTMEGSGTTAGSNVWYALPVARRQAIGQILLYSNQMWNKSISVSTTAYANNPNVPLRIATQMLIYEIVCGLRDPSSFVRNASNECGTAGDVFYNAGAASVSGFASAYSSLEAGIRSANLIPSFTSIYSGSAPVITLTGKDTSVLDTNGVLSGFSFTNGNGASFGKSGNTLYITQTGDISESSVFQATRNIPSAAGSTYDIWYMAGSGYQTTISLARASSGNLTCYFRLKGVPQTGGISLTKTTEDGQNLSGWQFGIYADSGCTSLVSGPYTTDASGRISVSNLNVGTYYVKELGHRDAAINARYACASTNPQAVTVTAGGTASVSFQNKLTSGSVKLIKRTNTGLDLGGWSIGLYTDANCTAPVSGSPFTTGEDGTVVVDGLTPGTYYARENPTENSYWDIDAEVKSVTVTAGQTAELTFVNTCYGRIEFHKTTNTGSHLGGWTFVVCNADGETVGTYTTDENGFACSDNLPLGRYTVTEQPTQDDYWVAELGFHDVVVTAGQSTVDTWHNKEQGLVWIYKKTNTEASVQGWQITIYSDEGCTQAIGTLTTSEEGKAGYYLAPGTYWAKETGNQNVLFENEYWVVDTTVQKFEVKPHESTEMVFSNTHCGKLEIVKTMEGSGSVEGWQFKITGPDGAEIEGSPFATDKDGNILTGNLLPGDYTVEELIPEDIIYSCGTENPITVTVKAGETAHIPFTNCIRPARIWIEKVDNTGNHLAGAVFRLEWSADNGQTWANIFYSDKQEPVKGGCSNVELADGCLTSNGKGELAWNNLYPGLRYRVTETQAPEGYTRLKGTAFDDTITVKDLDVTIRVVNNRGFLLPKTGSASLKVVSLVGAIALAGSLVVILSNTRRKKR